MPYLHSTLAHFNYFKQHHVFHTILLVMSIHPIWTTRFPSSVSTFPLFCRSFFTFFTGLQSHTHTHFLKINKMINTNISLTWYNYAQALRYQNPDLKSEVENNSWCWLIQRLTGFYRFHFLLLFKIFWQLKMLLVTVKTQNVFLVFKQD